jgi:hypothetical protein
MSTFSQASRDSLSFKLAARLSSSTLFGNLVMVVVDEMQLQGTKVAASLEDIGSLIQQLE